ncbi:hypothetical protein [Devosia sp. 1566]|uniref:hypothetical protein n=1 Tax=Devosia sp. 1566 TaxID=2499144 RepID=UPI000FDA5528|nr:hypothetical protein [Devosia sp. 1566]
MRNSEAVFEAAWTRPAKARRPVASDAVFAEDVEAEAERRLRLLRIDEWRRRAFVTGRQMPPEIRQIEDQINLATAAICRLAPIPADYRDDVYWPQHWR